MWNINAVETGTAYASVDIVYACWCSMSLVKGRSEYFEQDQGDNTGLCLRTAQIWTQLKIGNYKITEKQSSNTEAAREAIEEIWTNLGWIL